MIAARSPDRVGPGPRRMDEFPMGLPARLENYASRGRRAIGEKGGR